MSHVRRSAALLGCIAALALFSPFPARAAGITPVPVNAAGSGQNIQQPFQLQLNCSADGGFNIRCFATTVVPAGQRWMIEYVSANCRIDRDAQTLSQAWISTVMGSSPTYHFLTISDRVGAKGDSGEGINVVQLGQLVRLYADPGTTIVFSAGTSGQTQFSGYPYCIASLSGQAFGVP